jgi:hypothetical protein
MTYACDENKFKKLSGLKPTQNLWGAQKMGRAIFVILKTVNGFTLPKHVLY